MTFWESLGVAVSAAGLFASILGAFLTYAARRNGKATRDLIQSMEERMTALLERMDKRAEEGHREVTALLERMDKRAQERHWEVIQVISALKAT